MSTRRNFGIPAGWHRAGVVRVVDTIAGRTGYDLVDGGKVVWAGLAVGATARVSPGIPLGLTSGLLPGDIGPCPTGEGTRAPSPDERLSSR